MIESQANNKNVKMMLNIFAILLGIGIVLGVSYAIFRTMDVGKKTNVITTGNFGLEIRNESTEGISVTNALPMTFEEGMKTTPYTFTLANTGEYAIDYKLGLEAYTDSNMPPKAIRYLLVPGTIEEAKTKTNADTKLVSQAIEEEVLDENNETKKVYYIETGKMDAGASQDYVLYMWIDYDATTEIVGTKFKVRARADGEATKIVEETKEFVLPTEEQLSQMQKDPNMENVYKIAESDNIKITYSANVNLGESSTITDANVIQIDVTDENNEILSYGFFNKDVTMFLSEDISFAYSGNNWYVSKVSANPEQGKLYKGPLPFNKSDLTTIHSQSYLEYILTLFE